MKISSKTGTALISIGAGIIPALFVSCIATACLAGLLWAMNPGGAALLPIPDEFGYFRMLALEYLPYGGIALTIHALSIWLASGLNWSVRAGLYGVCGGVLGASFLHVQLGLSGLTFQRVHVLGVHNMVILGVLTALITYAVYGVLLYAVRKAVVNME